MEEKEIRWKTNFLLFSIYLCFYIFLIGCGNGKDSGIPEFQDDTSDITPGNISDRLVARIYFDATLSMQGFVVPGSTRYTQICPYLESVIVSGWRDVKADFFRFGEQVEPIDRGTYLQAGSVSFYENPNINRETLIQKVIDYEDQLVGNQRKINNTPEESTEPEIRNTPEELTEVGTPTEEVNESREENLLVVIVTDLFQDNSDINLLVNQLKEKYINKDLEIGLFGLRSQFNGTVYDTGIGQEPLPHQSDPKDPETFRPFYLLVLGRHADIAHYFDRLTTNGFSKAQTIIFSRYLVSSLLSFDDASMEPKPDNLNSDTFESVPPRVKQFRIVDDSEPAGISATLKYDPLPHTMFFDTDTFESNKFAKYAPIEETKRNPDAENCLIVKSKLSKNELSVDFSLASNNLQSAVYLYEVTLSPNVEKYRAPDWCSDWDMGEERDGSKTLNLVNFVSNLSQVTARMHQPKIAKFHFYIEKR